VEVSLVLLEISKGLWKSSAISIKAPIFLQAAGSAGTPYFPNYRVVSALIRGSTSGRVQFSVKELDMMDTTALAGKCVG
jgi:hypothetical protein